MNQFFEPNLSGFPSVWLLADVDEDGKVTYISHFPIHPETNYGTAFTYELGHRYFVVTVRPTEFSERP